MHVNESYFYHQLKLNLEQRSFVLILLLFFQRLEYLLKQITVRLVFIVLIRTIQFHSFALLITENHVEIRKLFH